MNESVTGAPLVVVCDLVTFEKLKIFRKHSEEANTSDYYQAGQNSLNTTRKAVKVVTKFYVVESIWSILKRKLAFFSICSKLETLMFKQTETKKNF
jgi:hypothetical protein